MSHLSTRYHELSVSYLRAAQKLWRTEPYDHPFGPDHLAIPTLNCLALAFEISLKGVLIAKGEDPATFQDTYGHKLTTLWQHPQLRPLREATEAHSDNWSYPQHWPGTGSNFDRFEHHLKWLNDVFSGKAEFKGQLILRYPEGDRNEFIPPDFMLEACATVLKKAEDKMVSVAK